MKYWTRSGWGWTLALLAWVVCGAMEAATVKQLAERSRWPGYRSGSAEKIQVFGSYAYVHAGGLQVFDVSDPNSLRPVGGFGLADSDFISLACVSNYAVGTHHEGFTVIDLSNPKQPRPMGGSTNYSGYTWCTLNGPYAYLVQTLKSQISVFNLANPAQPVALGTLNATSMITALKVQGDSLYVLTDSALQIFDLATPGQPQWVSTLASTNKLTDVSVLGNYAYAPFYGGIQILDISNPVQPVPVTIWQPHSSSTNGVAKNSVKTSEVARDCLNYSVNFQLVIEGNLGYLTGGPSGVSKIDLTDPVHPVLLGTYHNSVFNYYPFGVAVAGNYIFLVNGDDGVDVADLSHPAESKSLSTYPTKMDARCVAITGHYACLGHYTGGLTVVDISNPDQPVRTGFYRAKNTFWGMAASGNYVYLSNNQGLDVLDISDGGKPVLAGRYTNSTPWSIMSVMSIAVSDKLAFAVNSSDSLETLDLTDPSHPKRLGQLYAGLAAERLTVNGSYAYVSCAFGTVVVFDVSVPAHPKQVARYTIDGSVSQTAGWGSYIFEGNLSAGIRSLDFAEQFTPTHLSLYQESWPLVILDLALVDKTLYVCSWDGLRVLDTSNPAKLKLVGTASGFYAWAVAVGERNVCVSANENGLIVLDLYPEPPKLSVQVDASGYHLTLFAQAGRNVLIQRSTDLVHWDDWIVLEATGQAQTLTDPLGDNVTGQYYRASLLPN